MARYPEFLPWCAGAHFEDAGAERTAGLAQRVARRAAHRIHHSQHAACRTPRSLMHLVEDRSAPSTGALAFRSDRRAGLRGSLPRGVRVQERAHRGRLQRGIPVAMRHPRRCVRGAGAQDLWLRRPAGLTSRSCTPAAAGHREVVFGCEPPATVADALRLAAADPELHRPGRRMHGRRLRRAAWRADSSLADGDRHRDLPPPGGGSEARAPRALASRRRARRAARSPAGLICWPRCSCAAASASLSACRVARPCRRRNTR